MLSECAEFKRWQNAVRLYADLNYCGHRTRYQLTMEELFSLYLADTCDPREDDFATVGVFHRMLPEEEINILPDVK